MEVYRIMVYVAVDTVREWQIGVYGGLVLMNFGTIPCGRDWCNNIVLFCPEMIFFFF